jgi:ABC-2 type transport system permease protein
VARVRWQLTTRLLFSSSGRVELLSRLLMAFAVLIGGFAGAAAFGLGAYWFASQGHLSSLALLLWPALSFWQLFPVMAAALTENVDASDLLRFPLAYPTYFLIRLVSGAVEPATLVASLWLVGMLAGVGVARPALLASSALALAMFALWNVLATRLIFAWIEHWLARRRTREVLAVSFLLGLMSVQVVAGMSTNRRTGRPMAGIGKSLDAIERVSPPGLAIALIRDASPHPWRIELGAFLLFALYDLAMLELLHLRWRAQFGGENPSQVGTGSGREGELRRGEASLARALARDLATRALPSPVSAMFERELRHLCRSAPMLLTLLAPLFMMLLLRHAGRAGPLAFAPGLAFPMGAAYAMLLLSNLVYNHLGAEGCGIQFFFLSPIRFRELVLAKNLAHATIYAAQIAIVWLAVGFLFKPPSLSIAVGTLAGALFAAPLNFAAGNLLSLYAPKRIDMGTFGRQRAASVTILLSLGLQLAIFTVIALVLILCRNQGTSWLATPVFLAAGAVSGLVYGMVFRRLDRLALARREILVRELCRA